VQPSEFLRNQFGLYRLWVLQCNQNKQAGPFVGDDVEFRFLDRHERRDWIFQRTRDADWDQYRTAIANDHDLVLAQRQGKTLGWAWMGYDKVHLTPLGREIHLPENAVYLYDSWVKPEERGHGIGTALVAARCERADQRDATTLLTHVVEGNRASRSALESNGFAIVGRTGFLRAAMIRLWMGAPFPKISVS
jgi:GNAT superfamily N-acetyltransferase